MREGLRAGTLHTASEPPSASTTPRIRRAAGWRARAPGVRQPLLTESFTPRLLALGDVRRPTRDRERIRFWFRAARTAATAGSGSAIARRPAPASRSLASAGKPAGLERVELCAGFSAAPCVRRYRARNVTLTSVRAPSRSISISIVWPGSSVPRICE